MNKYGKLIVGIVLVTSITGCGSQEQLANDPSEESKKEEITISHEPSEIEQMPVITVSGKKYVKNKHEYLEQKEEEKEQQIERKTNTETSSDNPPQNNTQDVTETVEQITLKEEPKEQEYPEELHESDDINKPVPEDKKAEVAAFENYVIDLTTKRDEFLEHSRYVSNLMTSALQNKALVNDQNWKNEMTANLNVMDDLLNDIASLSPPESLQSAHNEYMKFVSDARFFTNNLVAGIYEGGSLFEQVVNKIDEATGHLKTATEMFIAVLNKQ